MDSALGLGIVPRTEVVTLASPAFHYSPKHRTGHRLFSRPLPPKSGSFQLYLSHYQDSTAFFYDGYDKLATDSTFWTDQDQREFRMGFERLVILDYLIRNTDRK